MFRNEYPLREVQADRQAASVQERAESEFHKLGERLVIALCAIVLLLALQGVL